MTSYVYIFPLSNTPAANATAAEEGYGPENFTVPLQSTTGPEQYVGACSYVELSIPAPTTWSVTYSGIVSVSDTETPLEHWNRVLTENGLEQVTIQWT